MLVKKKSLRPNSAVGLQPKAMTKSAMLKEAQLKEALKKEYLRIQEAVRATEFVLPFAFYDGKNVPGGKVRLKKGDKIWLFLERARKLGAELGRGDKGRKDWARISVDDLMVVRGDIIIPHVSIHHSYHSFRLHLCMRIANTDFHSQPALRLPLLPPQPHPRLSRSTLHLLRRSYLRNACKPLIHQILRIDSRARG